MNTPKTTVDTKETREFINDLPFEKCESYKDLINVLSKINFLMTSEGPISGEEYISRLKGFWFSNNINYTLFTRSYGLREKIKIIHNQSITRFNTSKLLNNSTGNEDNNPVDLNITADIAIMRIKKEKNRLAHIERGKTEGIYGIRKYITLS